MKNLILAIACVVSISLGITACAKKEAPASGGSDTTAAGGGDKAATGGDRAATIREMQKAFTDEVINKGNLDAANKYMAEDYVEHGPPEMPGKGIKAFTDMFAQYKTAFPDMHSDIVDIVVDGNKVVVISKTSATFKGDLMGMKATGKTGKDLLGMDYMVLNDSNKATDHWGLIDVPSMAAQMGMVMPSSPPDGHVPAAKADSAK